MNLTREDFYTGAFLSYLLNNNDVSELTLFEGNEKIDNRKIYDFLINDEFRVYIKYIEKPRESIIKGKVNYNWTFPFTDGQIDEIKMIKDDIRNFYFVFICGYSGLKDSKVVVIKSKDIFKCIDINRENQYKKQQVNIRLVKSQRSFDLWGTTRSAKKSKKDNTIKIKRSDNFSRLFGSNEVLDKLAGNTIA